MSLTNNMLVAKFTKLWRRNSAAITEDDPTFKTVYLGNTITQWAKGESSVDKPLSTLWRNYCQSTKPDIEMRVTLSLSGLKATTRQHGLTEYWNYRLTYACAHPNFPKVFCWIYRHEGRRLKPELRCHAVLCVSESKALLMQRCLRQRLYQALVEFRKEKQLRQNWRLSPISVLYPNVPSRNRCVTDGASNYRPPVDHSRSAPRLVSIVEDVEGELRAAAADDHSRRLRTISEPVTSKTEGVESSNEKAQETSSFNSLDFRENVSNQKLVRSPFMSERAKFQSSNSSDATNDRSRNELLDVFSEYQDELYSDRIYRQSNGSSSHIQTRDSFEENQTAENPPAQCSFSDQLKDNINNESSSCSSNSEAISLKERNESTNQKLGYPSEDVILLAQNQELASRQQTQLIQKQNDLELFRCKCSGKEWQGEKVSLDGDVSLPSSLDNSNQVCRRLYELSEQISDDVLCDAGQCGRCSDWLHMAGELDAASDSSSVPSDPTGHFTPDSPASPVPAQLGRITALRHSCRRKLATGRGWIDELEDGGASDESGYSEERETIHVV